MIKKAQNALGLDTNLLQHLKSVLNSTIRIVDDRMNFYKDVLIWFKTTDRIIS